MRLQFRFGLTRSQTRRLPSEAAARRRRRRRLEPIQAKGVLCGGVSEDYVRVVEQVEAVQRQRVEFQVVQGELGVDVEADVCGQGAREVLEQAGGRLSTDYREAERSRGRLQRETDVYQRGFQIKRDGLQAQIRYRSASPYVWVIIPESATAGCLMS